MEAVDAPVFGFAPCSQAGQATSPGLCKQKSLLSELLQGGQERLASASSSSMGCEAGGQDSGESEEDFESSDDDDMDTEEDGGEPSTAPITIPT